jgi:hypothetical protein
MTLTELIEVDAVGPNVPLSTAGSRGLILGSVRDRDGGHLASFTEEMLIRAQPTAENEAQF